MGLLDSLFGGSREEREAKRIRELSKKTQEKYGDAGARTRALEQLRDIGSPQAIAALLQRFTVTTEPGITDAEEKEFTLSIITSFGDAAVGPVEDFIRGQDSVGWAVRCLEELVDEDRVIGTLTSVLDQLSREYVREPDKKVLLINHLADYKDPRIDPAVSAFLDDPSDEVRVAALQTLVKQGDTGAREAIVACLTNAEAPRVRTAAAGALADLGLPLDGAREQVAARLPAGYSLDDAGVVRRA
ncbi:HEAT repeat domain-containing protein [Vulgatibacter sp.]|uniref:HEAT repeat domain-containing protein n=1 Tax=Vulgatibacter sp. TaxID=1971226 RepID=UPI003569CBB1